MLHITVPKQELFDEQKSEFISVKEHKLCLEHSLVSISKWEAKWCKPFLTDDKKTTEEILDYIRCMTITQNVDPNVYRILTKNNIDDINAYIQSPMTATWFSEDPNKPKNGRIKKEVITSEVIYWSMINFNIPFECQRWHINRLLTLIRIAEIKNNPPKKMSKGDLAKRNRNLNALRRQQIGSNG